MKLIKPVFNTTVNPVGRSVCKLHGLLALTVLIFMISSCSVESEDVFPAGSGSLQFQSALTYSAEDLTGDDVAGFLYQIFDSSGRELLEERYVPLEDESLPDFIAGGLGDGHSFADAFFILLPGTYSYMITPMQDENTPSEICLPVTGEIFVEAGSTTEEVAFSQCIGEDVGALDITTYLNHKPLIINLEYNPSKYVVICELVMITVDAVDIDLEPLEISFELLSGPPGSDPYFEVEGDTLHFEADTEGTYWVRVVVEDIHGSSASLEFPIHVSFTEDADCSVIGPEEEEKDPDVFRTQTQGGWGTEAAGNNPGAYRDANFDDAFPNGLYVGCEGGFFAVFSTSEAIAAFLPQGGPPLVFTALYFNPLSTSAGELGGQVVALTLSVGFDDYDASFSNSTQSLAEQVVVDSSSPCEDMSVEQILNEANMLIGGCSSTFTASQINECVTHINENYVDGDTDNGYLVAP